jgi:predicted SAM-dependent methyltransferase
VGKCRNCGAGVASDLGYIGQIAPFFLKRVLNLESGVAHSDHPVKRFLRKMEFFRKGFQRIYGTSVLAEMEICTACSFIQTKLPFPDESLGRLYVDYRSDSYNQERVRYEPAYASVADLVGKSDREIQTRVEGLTNWLMPKLELGSDFSMLDYGGADGRFLPKLDAKKYVYEISDIDPIQGIVKVKDEASLASYSYIQIAHVLEHVSYPLTLTIKAASHLKSSGYLYIEVPQDLTDNKVAQLANGDRDIAVTIHEHINFYTTESVTKLLQAAGLDVIEVRAEERDLGWNKGTNIRALGKKS